MSKKIWDFVEDETADAELYFLKDKRKRLISIDEIIVSPISFSADISIGDKVLSFRPSDTVTIREDENYYEFSIFGKYGCILSKL